MNPADLRKMDLAKILGMLSKAAKSGIAAIANGEISVLAVSGMQYNFYSAEIRMYFRMGGGEENYPSWPK